MKILVEKIKIIAIILTILNLGIGVFGFYQALSPVLVISILVTVELIILVLYLITVIYRWVRIHLNLMNESRLNGNNLLQSKIEQLEISQVKLFNDSKKEIQAGNNILSAKIDALEKLNDIKFSQLSNSISALLQKFEILLNEFSAKQIIAQIDLKEEQKKSSAQILALQEALKDLIVDNSKEQTSDLLYIKESSSNINVLQQEIIAQINQKSDKQNIFQQGLKEDLKETTAKVISAQKAMKMQIDQNSIAQKLAQQDTIAATSNINALQNEIKTQINEKYDEHNLFQQGLKEELKETTAKVISAQKAMEMQIDQNSIEQKLAQQDTIAATSSINALQNEIKTQINEKYDEHNLYQQGLKEELKETTAKVISAQKAMEMQIDQNSIEQKLAQQDTIAATSSINALQNEIKTQINEKSVEQTLSQQGLKEATAKVMEMQLAMKDRIEKQSIEQTSAQEWFVSQVDEKINKLLFNQQGINKSLEINGLKSEKLPSEIISAISMQTSSLDYNLIRQLNNTYDRIDALFSIHKVLNLNAPLPIMHDWRVSSDYAHATLSSLLEIGEGSVIDIGSGISTLLFGYGVKKNGSGKVIALEHSKEYFEKSLALIKLHKLEDYCELYYCPLKEYEISGEKWLWYNIQDVKFPTNISLISIDGPPGDTQHLARYPAMSVLKKNITNKTVIYLDDGNRQEEQEIVKRWAIENKLNQFESKDYKGYFKLTNH